MIQEEDFLQNWTLLKYNQQHIFLNINEKLITYHPIFHLNNLSEFMVNYFK